MYFCCYFASVCGYFSFSVSLFVFFVCRSLCLFAFLCCCFVSISWYITCLWLFCFILLWLFCISVVVLCLCSCSVFLCSCFVYLLVVTVLLTVCTFVSHPRGQVCDLWWACWLVPSCTASPGCHQHSPPPAPPRHVAKQPSLWCQRSGRRLERKRGMECWWVQSIVYFSCTFTQFLVCTLHTEYEGT